MSGEGSDVGPAPSKQHHLKLAGVVKGVHAKLRKTYKKGERDHEALWAAHLEDKQLLSEYADAMHHLATDIWTKHPETRIHWCRKTCSQYFFHENGLKKQLDKDKKRKYYAQLSQESQQQLDRATSSEGGSSVASEERERLYSEYEKDEESANANSLPVPGFIPSQISQSLGSPQNRLTNDFSDFDGMMKEKETEIRVSSLEEHEWATQNITNLEEERKAVHGKYEPRQYSKVKLPFSGLIRLLDVGSCYNPFLEFEEFLAVGIDISPAVESVYNCDFLHVEATDPLQLSQESIEAYLRKGLKDPIVHLPSELFHVVVFSLLLEYFPSPYQRWICCQRAHEFLAVHGLLIVITPDSHHQNKNMKMIKSWQAAIEGMGFKRWRYEKLDHLHCMAFRKLEPGPKDSANGSMSSCLITADMLYIPQDYNNGDNEDVCDQACAGRMATQSDLFNGDSMHEQFGELPDFVDL